MTTRLLISVRDCQEARAALDAGADLIDVKEPRRGALGAVDPETLRQIVRTVAGRTPISAAMGELLEDAERTAAALPAGVTLAKFGLAGCRDRADWPARLAGAVAALPHGAAGVAVIYADNRLADAPAADEVIRHALAVCCRAVLVDTHDKLAGSLLDLWTFDECRRVIEQIRAAGMLAVMAGSLKATAIARLLPLEPDYVAVRGAVCRGSREGSLDGKLLSELVAIVRQRRQRLVGA
ncbi:MAG TPA: (5-formylfuran-3-yl)methyl phosphate synthase [Pirellulales bacterium]|jgi:hypothetical protein